MAAVLQASRERHARFSPDPLRCPIAQRYFLDDTDITSVKSPIHDYPLKDCPSPITSSAPSSIPPSPDFTHSTTEHLPSTPATLSSLSLSVGDCQDDTEIILPAYDTSTFHPKEPESLSEISLDSSADIQDLSTQTPAADDNSIEEEPSRHVDYLSHEWKEEDIWASWRYVVSRRDVYDNGVRLENASWRTWAKLKLNRGTISPETLNWLKDCDVTWLYGPLKNWNRDERKSNVSPPPSRLDTPTLYQDRKPILKKRTASETILLRSLSQNTLLQHAGAILKAQEAENSRNRPSLHQYTSELGKVLDTSSDSSTRTSLNGTPTNTASGANSPSERRHIHFNNEVVQCIAVEAKGYEECGEWPATVGHDSHSDNGVVMMKQIFPQPSISGRSTPRNSFNGENKTIAPLPPTTLKSHKDTPEPPVGSLIDRWTGYLSTSSASPASSVETLRPSDSSVNFFLNEEDSELDFNWEPTQQPQAHTVQSRPWFVNPEDDEELDRHLNGSSSGGGEPCDESEHSNASMFDRVTDTVNTAKDIIHVIWNVGWRR